MRDNKKRLILIVLGLLALLGVLAAGVLVSRQIAVRNAVRGCNPSYGLQPMQAPTQVRARLSVLGLANAHLDSPADYVRPVWVVDMQGKWLLAGGPPPAAADPGPFYWDQCTQVIDALTGEVRTFPIE